ncbi:MAG TPA: anti-sigma regulatory factor [Firmicutes bacterium]|nr:anti-sigma regulatory factor [Bacillota bacterium]
MTLEFRIRGMEFNTAGDAASKIKEVLQKSGMEPTLVRRATIVSFELELNIIIHAYFGRLRAVIKENCLEIAAKDRGPGIPDIELAMQEGYSTAPPFVKEMGFGAGMGLPNIKKNSDILVVRSRCGAGTFVYSLLKR